MRTLHVIMQNQLDEYNPINRRTIMSTWLSDVRKSNPQLAADYALVGNQSVDDLRGMVKALSLPISQFMNTAEDETRLAAAKRIIKARRHA